MLKRLIWLFYLIFLVVPFLLHAQEASPRTVIILYKLIKHEKDERFRLSQILETPLNHLGLTVEYHNILKGLPNLKDRDDVRGVLSWYESGSASFSDPRAYVKWLTKLVNQGKKVVIMEEAGFFDTQKGWDTQKEDINGLLSKLGIQFTGKHITQIFDLKLKKADHRLIEFERTYDDLLPTLDVGLIKNKEATSYLDVIDGEDLFPLITVNENGGYVSQGYSLYVNESNTDNYRAWYINPFEFFREAFGLEGEPIPDTTTLTGNRIYYSHIDGDGWNSLTQIEKYKGKEKLCCEILLEKIFKAYPNFPVTVGPIGADLDSEWVGKEKSREVARHIFQLPNIEIASHTYSHPFSWEFFTDPNNSEKEKAYFDYYPPGYTWETKKNQGGLWESLTSNVKGLTKPKKRKASPKKMWIDGDFDLPRAFAQKPFNLEREIVESCRLASSLGPEGKEAQIILWSGNTSPDVKALKMAEALGVQNMNGGDTRFDWENYSYTWVAPKGRKVGDCWQIYTSMANETIYTHTWKERFYSYKELIQTVENTECPIRLNPFNIYYHIYIAEKEASLNSLIHNLEYAKRQALSPMPASEYAKLVQGFYKTKLIKLSDSRWRIEDRGNLQTIRFDKATLKALAFEKSKGVIGQRHFQGSLYVSLDPSEKTPIISLKDIQIFGEEVHEEIPYVIQSNWQIKNLIHKNDISSFSTSGFGNINMKWKVPNPGAYKIEVSSKAKVVHTASLQVNKDHLLYIKLPVKSQNSIQIKIIREVQHA